ncbi:ABC transporter permease [Elioraea sp.]|uniref:ABC transporter permease n=1 Tax=Elioraea sp. TaxID=2185103 RepID=UPI0025BC016E|nr:ABC transporter permease [Elioraea sp.]
MAEPRRDTTGLLLLAPLLGVLTVAFLVPVLSLVPTSLRPYVAGRGIGEGWTLEHYTNVLTDSFYLEILARTIGLGFVVTLATLVIGYPLAYILARSESRWRHWLTLLVIFPMLLNLVVRTFGWIALLARRGLVNQWLMGLGITDEPLRLMFNFTGLMIGLTHIFLPVMVLVLIAVIQNIPRDLEEAAGVLGASRAAVFAKVVLPLSAPGILAGSILVFVLTVSALVTPRLLGGPTYKVVSTLVYEQFLQLLNWPAGSALALLMTAIVLLLLWVGARVARRWEARE